MNTLSVAIARGDAGAEARTQFHHTANIDQQIEALTRAFRVAASDFVDTVTVYKFLAGDRCHDTRECFRRVLGVADGNGANGNGRHASVHGALAVVNPEITD